MSKLLDFLNAMKPYINLDGFAAGTPCSDQHRTCDNHVMFTGEYLRIAHDLDPSTFFTKNAAMSSAQSDDGLLHRYIATQDTSPDLAPDDYLGFLNYCSINPNLTALNAYDLMMYAKNHWWCYTVPWTGAGFLWRMPQLYAAVLAASGKLRFWHLPIVIYSSLVLLVTNGHTNDMDSWRLAWHLWNIMKTKSLLHRITGKVFWWKLRRELGDGGMRTVFGKYFNPSHPFAQYAVNPWDPKIT